MFKKHAPTLFVILSLICIKISSQSSPIESSNSPRNLELFGLKITADQENKKTTTFSSKIVTKLPSPKVIEKCVPIQNHKELELDFIEQHKAALTKILGPWYFEKPKTLDYNYEMFREALPSAIYTSSLYALPIATQNLTDKKSKDRYVPLSLFYKLYYSDRSNSDSLFYLYTYYLKLNDGNSSVKYIVDLLKESNSHTSFSSLLYKDLLKLAKTPEDLMAVHLIMQTQSSLSSSVYKKALLELDRESRIEAAKKFIKKGADKTAVNPGLDWDVAMYKAAYEILDEEDSARAFRTVKEIKEIKADSNRSFTDRLPKVKTNCDLEEVWSIAAPVIRELS